MGGTGSDQVKLGGTCTGCMGGILSYDERGSDNDPTSSANSKMIEAIEERDDEQVSAALQSGANASLKWGSNMRPALVHAVCHPNPSNMIIKALFASTACDPTAADKMGWTVFHWIAQAGEATSLKLWQMLTKEKPKSSEVNTQFRVGANMPDHFGLTPLHVACLYGCDGASDTPTRDFIKKLLTLAEPDSAVVPPSDASGAKAIRFKGWTALHFAAVAGCVEATEALLQEGRIQNIAYLEQQTHADSSAAVGVTQRTAFMLCARNLLRSRDMLIGRLTSAEERIDGTVTLGAAQVTTTVSPANAKKIMFSIIDLYAALKSLRTLQPQIDQLRKEMESFNKIPAGVAVAKEVEKYFKIRKRESNGEQVSPEEINVALDGDDNSTQHNNSQSQSQSQDGGAKKEGPCSCF